MKTEKNILIAFLLNFCFAIFEFIGGALSGSVAITSDAMHDMGDAISIAISYWLERQSKKEATNTFTYGYVRYSVFGGVITTSILAVGSLIMIVNAVKRIFNPVEIHYNGMILLAIIGVIVNVAATFITKDGDNLNQKAVNLHMLEDVLGWVVVLIGAILMRFTNITLIDPILSILVSSYILYHAIRNLKEILMVFLEKVPDNVHFDELEKAVNAIEGVNEIHHVHIWTIDGSYNLATMHVVTDVSPEKYPELKKELRHILRQQNVDHVTLELEFADEVCEEKEINHHHKMGALHSNHHHHH